MAWTRPSSLSSRPESLAIIQPLNSAPAAASIADIAETRVKVSMAFRFYHLAPLALAVELAAERREGAWPAAGRLVEDVEFLAGATPPHRPGRGFPAFGKGADGASATGALFVGALRTRRDALPSMSWTSVTLRAGRDSGRGNSVKP